MPVPTRYAKSSRHRVLYATMRVLDDTETTGPFGHFDRAAVHKAVSRRQDLWEATIVDQLTAHFNAEREEVMRVVENGDHGLVESIIAETTPDLRQWLAKSYEDVATVQAKWVRQHIRTKARRPDPDPLDRDARRYLQRLAGRKVKDISKTTLKQLRRVLAQGLDAGEGTAEIARRIDKLYLDDIIPNRSATIARTEVATASNYASLRAARETGVGMTKTWNTNLDGRERDSHREADTQTVGLDERFTVGLVELGFPGDPTGPAAEIINCRCYLSYTVND